MVFSVIFFVIGVLMFVFTRQFSYNGLEDFGTGFWPRMIAIIMMICAVALFLTSLLSKDQGKDEVIIDWKDPGMKRMLKVAGVLIVFCVALYFVGLCIALVLMIFCIMLCMEERRIPYLLITPIAMSLFIFVVFQLCLKVNLPMGILLS